MIYQIDIWYAKTVEGKVPLAQTHVTETHGLRLTNFRIPLRPEPDGRYHDRLHVEVPKEKNIFQITGELHALESVLDVLVRECPDGKMMPLPKEDPTDYQ